MEDDTRSSDQLLQVLKYIRQEKNIAVAQADALRAEALRLKSQVELQGRQLSEAHEMLQAERSQSQVHLSTTSKHEELLRKVSFNSVPRQILNKKGALYSIVIF